MPDNELRLLAISNLNSSYCRDIIDQGLKEHCNNVVHLRLAVINSDISICGNLTQGKADCTERILLKEAVASNDLNACLALSEKRKQDCIDLIYLNLGECDKIISEKTVEICEGGHE